jgi:hypothetical protein
VAHATLGGRATGDLLDECGEVAGAAPIAVQHQGALVAAVGPFGPAQFGFHTPQPEQVLEEGYQQSARCTVLAAQPVLYSIDLATEFGHADAGDAPGEAPVAQHPGDA